MESLSPLIRYRLVASAAHTLATDGNTSTELVVISVDPDGEHYGIALERDGRAARPMAPVPAGLADHISDVLLPYLRHAAATGALLDAVLLSGGFLPASAHGLEVDEIARLTSAATEIVARGDERSEVEITVIVRDDQDRIWYAASVDGRRCLRDGALDLDPDTLAPDRLRASLRRMVASIVEERLSAVPF